MKQGFTTPNKKKVYRDGRIFHPLYPRYQQMHARCYNPKSINFKYYGGRGIAVCDRWCNSRPSGFWYFVKDMSKLPKPTGDHNSIDRIDNNGDYAPDNVRWATKQEQRANRRKD